MSDYTKNCLVFHGNNPCNCFSHEIPFMDTPEGIFRQNAVTIASQRREIENLEAALQKAQEEIERLKSEYEAMKYIEGEHIDARNEVEMERDRYREALEMISKYEVLEARTLANMAKQALSENGEGKHDKSE